MAFGFLKAPFKLITGAAKGVAKVATTVAKGAVSVGKFAVSRAPATITGFLAGGPVGAVAANAADLLIGAGGGAQPPPGAEYATPGYAGEVFTTTSTDRFSSGSTVQNWLANLFDVLPSQAQGAVNDLLETGRAEVRTEAAKGAMPLVIGGVVAALALSLLLRSPTPAHAAA